MTHQEQCPRELRERPFQRLDRMQVQVVGGLIHDEDRRIQKSARDHEFAQLAGAGHSAFQDAVGVGVELGRAAENAPAVGGGEGTNRREGARPLPCAWLLRDVGYGKRAVTRAGCLLREQASDMVEQRGFARAIGSHDADVLRVSHE